jgi:hypothetical protein
MPTSRTRCTAHRNNLPAWAQWAIDETFGPTAAVSRWSPGDGKTRYRIVSADGSWEYTQNYLGLNEFLSALNMLHAAVTYRERKALEDSRNV